MWFYEWFDIKNSEHLASLKHFIKSGHWPENFIPDEMKPLESDMDIIFRKIAMAWIDQRLSECKNNQAESPAFGGYD